MTMLLKPATERRQRRRARREPRPNEVLIKCGKYFRTYTDLSTGKRVQYVYQTPQNYKNASGEWHEYSFTWRQEGDDWVSDGGPWSIRLNLAEKRLTYTDNAGDVYELELLEIGGIPIDRLPPARINEKNTENLVCHDVVEQVDITFRLAPRGVSILRILKGHSAARSFKWKAIGKQGSPLTKMSLDAFGFDNLNAVAVREERDQRRRIEISTEYSERVELPDGRNEVLLTETWSGRVSKTHKDRSKEWTTEVVYPVLIDPIFGPTDLTMADSGYVKWGGGGGTTWQSNWVHLYCGHLHVNYWPPEWQAVGLRWQSITCTQGCAISSATINVNLKELNGVPHLAIKPDLKANAPAFDATSLPNTAVTGTGTVMWSPTATGVSVNLPGVTSGVQAIVNQTAWTAGNAMRFAIAETRALTSAQSIIANFENQQTTTAPPTNAPSLRIAWTTDAGTTPIVIDRADTITAADTKTATDAVAHDASSSSSDTNTTTLSWSHTCTGNQLVLTVGVTVSPGSVSVSGITYNGDPLTLATNGRQAGTNVSTELWYLVNPDAGSAYTVAVTLDGTAYAVRAGAVSFRNASQDANPLGTIAKQTGTSTSSSLNVTSDGDQMVVDILGKFDDGTATVNSGQTQRWQEN